MINTATTRFVMALIALAAIFTVIGYGFGYDTGYKKGGDTAWNTAFELYDCERNNYWVLPDLQ